MQVRRFDTFELTFVLRPKDIRKLDNLLKEIDNPEYEVSCSDGLTRHFDSVEELIAFENSPDRKIEKVEASSSYVDIGGSDSQRAVLRFTNSKFSNVELSLAGTENKIEPLNRRIEEFFERIRPWYWRFSRVDYVKLGLGLLFVAFISLAVFVVLFHPETGNSESSTRSEITSHLILLGTLFLVVAGGIALNKLGERLFPCGMFAIGQGEDRYELREKIRWTVVIGFPVSLVASVVVALIL